MNTSNARVKTDAASDRFVTTRWLAAHLSDPCLRVVDVRSDAVALGSVRGGGGARKRESGTRLTSRSDAQDAQDAEDEPRFVDLSGVGGGWLRSGRWDQRRSRARGSASESREPECFRKAHVPGAVSLDVAGRLFDASGVLVTVGEVAMAMSEIGVGDDHTIVLVDDEWPSAALVAAWILTNHGHSETKILTGGFNQWQHEARPTSSVITRHPFASFTAKAKAKASVTAKANAKGRHF